MCNTRRPDLLSLPLSSFPSHGCLAWRCCRTVEVKTIQMWYDVFPSEGPGGEPKLEEKLGSETFQNYCQIWGSGPPPQMKMKKKAMQNEEPRPLCGALCTAEPRRTEELQKPCSSRMSSPTAAGSTSSEEGVAKSRVTIILENRARVDWEVETPKLTKADQQVLFSE